ncbi:hypothetical protein CPB83DRAFT_894565 [Crepidotus variabilis]|uniref:Uncharacterized protein n=1 Tax=Crepidotus variabilis TaxID=179855 RepID=A0A9P6EG75_9AGAR|nr:hypothetical protein CPB83DRAFT_894565 [Crepidotus variabilis]
MALGYSWVTLCNRAEVFNVQAFNDPAVLFHSFLEDVIINVKPTSAYTPSLSVLLYDVIPPRNSHPPKYQEHIANLSIPGWPYVLSKFESGSGGVEFDRTIGFSFSMNTKLNMASLLMPTNRHHSSRPLLAISLPLVIRHPSSDLHLSRIAPSTSPPGVKNGRRTRADTTQPGQVLNYSFDCKLRAHRILDLLSG